MRGGFFTKFAALAHGVASPYRDNVLKSQCSVKIKNFMKYGESDLWKVMNRMLSLAIFAVRVLLEGKKCLHFGFRKLKKRQIYNYLFLVMSVHKKLLQNSKYFCWPTFEF